MIALGTGGAPRACTTDDIADAMRARDGDVEHPTLKAKRKKSTSPTQRTLADLRKRGITAQVVERWNPHAHVRVDLFGVIDLVAIVPPVPGRLGAIAGIQACTGGDHAKRRDKILAEPRARAWVEAGGRLELWSWSQRGAAGKRKLWTLRVETYAEMLAGASTGAPT